MAMHMARYSSNNDDKNDNVYGQGLAASLLIFAKNDIKFSKSEKRYGERCRKIIVKRHMCHGLTDAPIFSQ
eukprot:6482403-Amphidinium_carterae.1